MPDLHQAPLLLASQSPRRREIISWLGLTAAAASADLDETPHPAESPADLTARLARAKALAVAATQPHAWIIAADTVVDCAGQPLGKPASPEEAAAMLRDLRDAQHTVHTGVALYDPVTRHCRVRRVTTAVWMRAYTAAEIAAYVAGGDPLDKAGAYAIQHAGFHPVARIERCYANVVGLPLCGLTALLADSPYAPVVPSLADLCRARFNYACPACDAGESL